MEFKAWRLKNIYLSTPVCLLSTAKVSIAVASFLSMVELDSGFQPKKFASYSCTLTSASEGRFVRDSSTLYKKSVSKSNALIPSLTSIG